jgi:hypothetical protein
MYSPFSVVDAVQVLDRVCNNDYNRYYDFADIADLGRRIEAYIIVNGVSEELNVWHEKEYCQHLINNYFNKQR